MILKNLIKERKEAQVKLAIMENAVVNVGVSKMLIQLRHNPNITKRIHVQEAENKIEKMSQKEQLWMVRKKLSTG
jgi:hypothetical protein